MFLDNDYFVFIPFGFLGILFLFILEWSLSPSPSLSLWASIVLFYLRPFKQIETHWSNIPGQEVRAHRRQTHHQMEIRMFYCPINLSTSTLHGCDGDLTLGKNSRIDTSLRLTSWIFSVQFQGGRS